jgi:hypothetical protein
MPAALNLAAKFLLTHGHAYAHGGSCMGWLLTGDFSCYVSGINVHFIIVFGVQRCYLWLEEKCPPDAIGSSCLDDVTCGLDAVLLMQS